MSALRCIVGATVATATCVAALAGPATAKISGTSGPLVAFERAGDIHVLNAAVAGVSVNLTNSPGVADAEPSWGLPDDTCPADPVTGARSEPADRTLVYESRPSGPDRDIVVAKLAGSPPALTAPPVNLTAASAADEGSPAVGIALNADASAFIPVVVFTRGAVGRRDIWAMRLDGSGATPLTSSPADDSRPDLSSDGASVVYETADANGRRQLAILDGAWNAAQERFVAVAPRFVTAGPQHHGDPSWWSTLKTPSDPPLPQDFDPSRLVHAASGSGTTYLDFVEQEPKLLTTGPLFAPASVPPPLLRQLTGDPGGDLAPSWRPEGDFVVFDSDRDQTGNRDIYRVRVDGGDLVRLTRDPAADRSPDWEPLQRGFCLDPDPYRPRPGTKTRTGPPLRAAGLKLAKAGTGNRRSVIVRFTVNRAATVSARLRRGSRTVATKSNGPVSAGAVELRLNVPKKAPGGTHSVRVTVTAGPARQDLTGSVKIRRLKKTS